MISRRTSISFNSLLILAIVTIGAHALPHENSAAADADLNPDADAILSRHKRAGEDACMQIYTVPKRTVKCDPSDEVRDALSQMREALEKTRTDLTDHAESVQGLGLRIDELDPDKEKQLPEEVQERLRTIDEMRETQAGHVESMRRIDGEMTHINDKMAQIEADDRAELASMIQQQSVLITAALHQANLSLHDEYIDRLASSTQDLSTRIQQLQIALGEDLRDTENRLEEQVTGSREEVLTRHGELSERLDSMLADLLARLREETENRISYQNKTERNSGFVAELRESLASVQEKQESSFSVDEGHTQSIDDLKSTVEQLLSDKAALTGRTSALEESVADLQATFQLMRKELTGCLNTSEVLGHRVQVLLETAQRREHLLPRMLKISDCQDVLKYYYPASGVYNIQPDPTTRPFDVFCDMRDVQGWTVVQRRQTGQVDFFRGWQAYKEGFGDMETEFWMGLNHLYHMTTSKRYRLRVDLEDWDGNWFYAEYDSFSIESEKNNYKLHIGGYHGNAGDSLDYHDGMPFSTMDNNNDGNEGICATWCRGAWWYKDCFESNLNGLYHKTGPYVTKTNWGDGMVWKHIKGTNFYSLKSSIMKIIPVHIET